MGSSRLASILSAAVSRISSSYTATGTSVLPGLLSPVASHNRYGSQASLSPKTSLRHSASLQDFSTLSRLDPEVGDHDIDALSHAKPLRSLQRETNAASFSKDKTSTSTSFTRKKWVQVALFLFCLLMFILSIYVIVVQFSTKQSQFYVILDCGSTGTRVYVYESLIEHQNGQENLPINLRSLPKSLKRKSRAQSGRAYQRMETEPGFDKLVRNMSGLRAAIKPLLKWAEKQIPQKAHSSTLLFLYATAGVRRLPSSDSDWLLEKAWSILKNSSFLCQRDWIKIISGMEEAYYGWIALNYHMGTLGSKPVKPTFGALDLGGSSLQVTFETDELVDDETSLNLKIGSVSHHLSAYSLPGYGLNDAFDKSVTHLLRKQTQARMLDPDKGKLVIEHPCLHSGYKESYVCSQCTSLSEEVSPTVGGKATSNRRLGKVVELLGAPNWEECSSVAKVAVNLSEWSQASSALDCEIQPCALRNDLPRPQGQFYAMSGFYVVFRFFNLTSKATLDDMLQKGQEFCKFTWESAKNSVAPQPYIEQYCFRAPYIYSLLRDGLHISNDEVFVGSGSITWTLGVALLQAGKALSSRVETGNYKLFTTKMDPATIMVLLVFSVVLLIFALACISNWIPKFFQGFHFPRFRQSATSSSVLNIPTPFRFQRWSPISTGEGRPKMPLSPTIAGAQQRPFGMGYGLGGSSIQLSESSLHLLGGGISHTYSSGSLGQMQYDNGTGSSWAPHRSQMQLQSRRSQSREDLSSSLGESHIVKV